MNDCPNADMRDLLPELLHQRLSATVRAQVTAHVDACTDCREELELLRGVHDVMVTYTPKIDVAYIVSALPAPPAPAVRSATPRRRNWADWRIAATVTLLAAGGTSVAVMNRDGGEPASRVALVPVSAGVNSLDSTPLRVASETTSGQLADRGEGEVGVAGIADLDDGQLESLIAEIEQMKAVPITEPEAVLLRVGLKDPGGE